jgi:hypothetical protein
MNYKTPRPGQTDDTQQTKVRQHGHLRSLWGPKDPCKRIRPRQHQMKKRTGRWSREGDGRAVEVKGSNPNNPLVLLADPSAENPLISPKVRHHRHLLSPTCMGTPEERESERGLWD